jgi:hypothetical protein
LKIILLDISKKEIIGDDVFISHGQGEAFGQDICGFEAEIVPSKASPLQISIGCRFFLRDVYWTGPPAVYLLLACVLRLKVGIEISTNLNRN